MKKEGGNNDDLFALLKKNILVLEQQNKLIRQLMTKTNVSKSSSVPKLSSVSSIPSEELLLPGEKIFVENLFHDEIRDGNIVTIQRKRLWNIQLNLIDEFDRICKKHNLRWFAYGGTLLGAARHKGFIPWDDDVDIAMLRPDYEKFKAVVKTEIAEPYFVDAWQDYRLEEEEPNILKNKSCQQIVRRDQRERGSTWWPFWPTIKLKDSRTTFAQYLDRPYAHQGIFIDIFPFDPVPDFSDIQNKINFEIERELLLAISMPKVIKEALKEEAPPLLFLPEEMENFLKLNHTKKALIFEDFALKHFEKSEFVGQLRDHCLVDRKNRAYAWDNFKKIIYLPFEKMQIPCPIGFEDCLISQYGDWHKKEVYQPHTVFYSADISYKEFFKIITGK